MRQPADRKIRDGVRKWTLRQIARQLVPADLVEAPKRPLQTPQREWLAGPLRGWVEDWGSDWSLSKTGHFIFYSLLLISLGREAIK